MTAGPEGRVGTPSARPAQAAPARKSLAQAMLGSCSVPIKGQALPQLYRQTYRYRVSI